jgi:hypothetical protein
MGGSYDEIHRRFTHRFADGSATECHHLIPKDVLLELGIDHRGTPSIQLKVANHARTETNGSSLPAKAARAAISRTLKAGRVDIAMARGLREVQRKFGPEHAEGLREADEQFALWRSNVEEAIRVRRGKGLDIVRQGLARLMAVEPVEAQIGVDLRSAKNAGVELTLSQVAQLRRFEWERTRPEFGVREDVAKEVGIQLASQAHAVMALFEDDRHPSGGSLALGQVSKLDDDGLVNEVALVAASEGNRWAPEQRDALERMGFTLVNGKEGEKAWGTIVRSASNNGYGIDAMGVDGDVGELVRVTMPLAMEPLNIAGQFSLASVEDLGPSFPVDARGVPHPPTVRASSAGREEDNAAVDPVSDRERPGTMRGKWLMAGRIPRRASRRQRAEAKYADEKGLRADKAARLSPQEAIENGDLRVGRWPFRSRFLAGSRLAPNIAEYLPFGLKSKFISWSLANPKRRYIPRSPTSGLVSRIIGAGSGAGAIPPAGNTLLPVPPLSWLRLPKEVREAKRLQVESLDKQMNWDSLARVLAERGRSVAKDMQAQGSVAPDGCLADTRWWKAQLDRCWPYEVSTPLGNVVLYRRPPAYRSIDKTQQEIINTALADSALRQIAELERPGSTDDPAMREAILYRAMTQARIMTTRDHGGSVNLGEIPVLGAYGRVSGYLTDTGARANIVIAGDTGSGKSPFAIAAATSADVPAIIIEEPKPEEVDAWASRLQKLGHRVVKLDLRPNALNRPDRSEFVSMGKAGSIFDYLSSPHEAPSVGFDPIGDIRQLVDPFGYKFAHTVAEEIFDSVCETLKKPGHISDDNIHLYRSILTDGIASCLTAAALDNLAEPGASFWGSFEDYWSTLTGSAPTDRMMARIESLKTEPIDSPYRVPELEQPGSNPFADINYRGEVFRTLMRDQRRMWERHEAVLGTTLVDRSAVDDMVGNAENFLGQIVKAGGGLGHDIPNFVFGTGRRPLHEAIASFDEPGRGMTVSSLYAANAIAMVKIGGETSGAIDLTQQWFSHAVDRQLAQLRELETAVEMSLKDRPFDAATVIEAYQSLGGLPSRATSREIDSLREAREAGMPQFRNSLLWWVDQEAGSLAQKLSPGKASADFKIGAKGKTGVYVLSKVADAATFDIHPRDLTGHVMIGIGSLAGDPELQWVLERASGPSGPRVEKWWPERVVNDYSYLRVALPGKVSGHEVLNPAFRNPSASDRLCIARLIGVPATSPHDRMTPYTADEVVARLGIRRDGALTYPAPRIDSMEGLVRKWWDGRAIAKASGQQTLPMSEIVHLGREAEEATRKLERLKVDSASAREIAAVRNASQTPADEVAQPRARSSTHDVRGLDVVQGLATVGGRTAEGGLETLRDDVAVRDVETIQSEASLPGREVLGDRESVPGSEVIEDKSSEVSGLKPEQSAEAMPGPQPVQGPDAVLEPSSGQVQDEVAPEPGQRQDEVAGTKSGEAQEVPGPAAVQPPSDEPLAQAPRSKSRVPTPEQLKRMKEVGDDHDIGGL